MKLLNSLTLGLALCGAGAAHAGVIVYDNLTTALGVYVGDFAYEATADDVFLKPGAGGLLESVTIAYFGGNFSGNETMTLTLYKMDGPPTPGSFGFKTPGTPIFTATGPIPETDGALITFTDSSGTIVLPETFAVAVSFGGLNRAAGESAGPLLFQPPAVGSSFDDYWLKGFPTAGADWGLFLVNGVSKVNFGVQITVVGDTDGDGLLDNVDHCPNSDLSPTVIIDGCNSGVPNTLFSNGCTIADDIASIAATAKNHGKFVSGVAQYLNDLKKAGVITGAQKGAIQSCAAKAAIP